jgi:hypothetical protein
VIPQSYITSNLKTINRSYLRASSQRESFFFSKLAILELCGWIEESMDDVVMRCAMRHLKQPDNRKYCKDDFVKRTWGFDYHKNFRFMLIRLLGLINVEKIEARVDRSKRDSMTAALSSLKAQRDAEAHTHLKGVTRTINAPSVTIAQFQPVYEGLREFDRVIRGTRW